MHISVLINSTIANQLTVILFGIELSQIKMITSPIYFSLKSNLLLFLIILPLIGAFFLIWTKTKRNLYKISLYVTLLNLWLSLFLLIFFDRSSSNFQFISEFDWLKSFNINFCLGIDGISLYFVLLTTFLIPLCILATWERIHKNLKEYLIFFLLLESFLILVFSLLDILLFYFFFEAILIPIFLIVGIWGSRERKIRAGYMLFFYTLVGSLFMLVAILALYSLTGTTDYLYLINHPVDESLQKFFWFAFFASFAVKVPMLPFHVWLPEAHVEAPTTGSVLLAGILLKLGSYGFIRFSLPLFPAATVFFTPFIYTLASISIVYSSLTAIRQTDMKRIIAYASVAHMNVIMIGIFSLNFQGLEGAIFQQLAHGIVSSALFLCIGIIYERYGSRMLTEYKGIVHTMPLFAFFFFIYTLGNTGFPLTVNFVGEFLILSGTFQENTSVAFLGATGMVLGACYSLWLFNRIIFGNLSTEALTGFRDIRRREFFVQLPFFILTFLLGIGPEFVIDTFHTSTFNLIESIQQNLSTSFSNF